MLRSAVKAGTELGKRAKVIMDEGGLVSDDIIIGLVKDRLGEPDCANGCLFDGFPRTIPQAEAMVDAGIDIDQVIEIDVDHEEIVSRMSGRRYPRQRSRVPRRAQPPAVEGIDDVTGEALIQRDDDAEDTVRHRLVARKSDPTAVDFYTNLEGPAYHQINGVGSVDSVTQSIRRRSVSSNPDPRPLSLVPSLPGAIA